MFFQGLQNEGLFLALNHLFLFEFVKFTRKTNRKKHLF